MQISIKSPNQLLRVTKGNKNIPCPKVIEELKVMEVLPENFELRESEYLNNVVDLNHQAYKQLVSPCLNFFTFHLGSANI